MGRPKNSKGIFDAQKCQEWFDAYKGILMLVIPIRTYQII